MAQDVVGIITGIITEKILSGGSDRRIDAQTPLLSSGLSLDSVAVLELLMEIENEFGVEFKDSDLSVDLFKSVGALAEAVQEKMPRPTA